MNVFKIGRYWIAANKPEQAYYEWLDYSSDFENLFDLSEIKEGEEWTEEITIKRLTSKQIDNETVPCCNGENDCDKCDGLNDNVYSTFREIIESKVKKNSLV